MIANELLDMQAKSLNYSAEQQRLADIIKSVHRQLRQKVKACTLCITSQYESY